MAKKKAARKSARPARTTAARKTPKRRVTKSRRPAAKRTRPRTTDVLLRPLNGVDRRVVAGVTLEIGRTGDARVKRVIYPPGFRWSEDMKPITGTSLCMHAHVGFLVRGEIHIEYADGCIAEFKAPQIVAIDPGHDGWVVGAEPAVLIEFDFEQETIGRLGMPAAHRH
jgi:hypothetical protein